MDNLLAIYKVNYNVLLWSDDYYIEMDKYVRLAAFWCHKERFEDGDKYLSVYLFSTKKFFYNYYVFESAIKNWQLQFFLKVKMEIPRGDYI